MIQTSESSIQYVGNNSTSTPYPVPYLFFENAHLNVVVTNGNGEDPQILGTDYNVTGAGNPDGGSITMTWAVPPESTVTIFRSVPFTQETAYEEGDSFPAKSHERALDLGVMRDQQLSRGSGEGNEGLGATFRLTEASIGIPPVSKLLDTMLGIDALGNTILRTPSDLLSWLGGGGTAWADAAERGSTRGAYAGQLGVQRDNWTIYVAHSTAPGDWSPFLPGTGIVYAVDGVPVVMEAPEGDLVGTTEAQTLSNKTFDDVTISGVSGLTKADVGLSNVDNTSDINKPVSAATNAALSTKQAYSEKAVANGYASLDATGKVPTEQLPGGGGGGGTVYKGTWNASTNVPVIPAAAVGNNGWFYIVATAGTTNVSGITSWAVGDQLVSNGTAWQKIVASGVGVTSVNSRTGVVTLTKADVSLSSVDDTSDATKNAAAVTLTNKTINGANNTLTVRLTNDVSGNLPTTRLNNGTGADATTWWCGDGTWKTPAGTGDVNGPSASVEGELPVFTGTTGKVLKRYAGGTGFAKVQNNAAVASQPLILAADLDPGVIHAQTQKTSALVDADEFILWDSSVSALRRVAAPLVRHLPGAVVQTVYAEVTSEINITGAIGGSNPLTSTAGTQFITANLTPVYSNSKILIRAGGQHSLWKSPAGVVTAAFWLIVSGTTAAITSTSISSYGDGMSQEWSIELLYTPGAGLKSYSLRASPLTTTGTPVYNLYINDYTYVATGYVPHTTLTLQEIKQ